MNQSVPVTRRRAGIDIAVQIVGRLLNFFPGVVVAVILARELGRSGYGEWATILSIVQIAGYVGDLGFEQVALSRAASEPDRAPRWLGALFSLRLAICVPLTLVCGVLQVVVAGDSDMALAGVLVAGTMLLAANGVGQLAFQIRVRNDLTVLTMTVQSILWTGAVIAIAGRDGSIVNFAAALLVTSAVASTIQLVLGWRMIPFVLRGARAHWPALMKVGVPLGIAAMLVQAADRLDQLLVFIFSGSIDAGYYAAAYRLLEAAHFVPVAVTATVFPILASAYRTDRLRVQRVSQTALEYLVALVLPAFAVTLAAGGPIIRLLFGSDFSEAASALPILMASLFPIVVGYLAGIGIVLAGLERRYVLYAAVGLAFNAAANSVLIPLYGFVAAAWVTLATDVLVGGLTARVVLEATGVRLRYGRVARAAVAAAMTAVATYLLIEIGVALGWVLFAAGAIYTILTLALRAIDPRDIRVLLARG